MSLAHIAISIRYMGRVYLPSRIILDPVGEIIVGFYYTAETFCWWGGLAPAEYPSTMSCREMSKCRDRGDRIWSPGDAIFIMACILGIENF